MDSFSIKFLLLKCRPNEQLTYIRQLSTWLIWRMRHAFSLFPKRHDSIWNSFGRRKRTALMKLWWTTELCLKEEEWKVELQRLQMDGNPSARRNLGCLKTTIAGFLRSLICSHSCFAVFSLKSRPNTYTPALHLTSLARMRHAFNFLPERHIFFGDKASSDEKKSALVRPF